MASSHYSRWVDPRALTDNRLSSQAVAVAAAFVSSFNDEDETADIIRRYKFDGATVHLATWELERAGYLVGGA